MFSSANLTPAHSTLYMIILLIFMALLGYGLMWLLGKALIKYKSSAQAVQNVRTSDKPQIDPPQQLKETVLSLKSLLKLVGKERVYYTLLDLSVKFENIWELVYRLEDSRDTERQMKESFMQDLRDAKSQLLCERVEVAALRKKLSAIQKDKASMEEDIAIKELTIELKNEELVELQDELELMRTKLATYEQQIFTEHALSQLFDIKLPEIEPLPWITKPKFEPKSELKVAELEDTENNSEIVENSVDSDAPSAYNLPTNTEQEVISDGEPKPI